MNEKNKDLLIYLLEGILKVKIKEVEYLNLEQNVDNIYVKRKHFDLNLKTDVGRIQVEVNCWKNSSRSECFGFRIRKTKKYVILMWDLFSSCIKGTKL